MAVQDTDTQAAGYRRWVDAMHAALRAGDQRGFTEAMNHFNALQEISVVTSVRKVTGELQAALEQFRSDSRLIDLAERQVPDARARLAHVLKLTDDAAHHTMDLVDQSCPLVDTVAREGSALLQRLGSAPVAEPLRAEIEAYLNATAAHMKTVRARLADVLLAQGYQDLSGQIIRSVMKLVDELELALGDLVSIGELTGDAPAYQRAAEAAGAHGPVVPGVAHGETVGTQDDIDAMLSGLGM